MALLIPMLVDELLWIQMLFFHEEEGVLRLDMSWLGMNLLVSSRISRQIRLDCSPVLTLVTVLIMMACLK